MLEVLQRRSRRNNAYRRLFFNEGGALKPEAETVLADLLEFTRFYKNSPADPQALAVAEGGRQVVRHILKCTKNTRQELERQLNRNGDNEDE